MQARPLSYKESVTPRRAPSFTGETSWYVVQPLCLRAWSHCRPVWTWPVHGCSWQQYFSSITSEHRASEASTRSTTNLCSPIIRVTFFTILVVSNLVAQRNSRLYKSSFDASVKNSICRIDCTRYGLDSRVVTNTTTDGHILRYCVPMDNQRPQLDLKFYKDICPDANGASL